MTTEDQTSPRTLWTETLLDMLGDALARQREDDARRILREIKAKGYSKAEVLNYVAKNMNEAQNQQVGRMMRRRRAG